MTDQEFQKAYSKLRAKFGQVFFGEKKAIQIFELFKPISDHDGHKIVDEILDSILLNINNPPPLEAFKNGIQKVQSEKKREEYRKQRVMPDLGPTWQEFKEMGHGDGLAKTLSQYGVSSVAELIQNRFKPRKV